jgi:chemosensory pili system protein ChpC
MSATATEVYSLLIPLSESRLLVPRACVAEVIAYQLPTPMENAPAWYRGSINWNGRSVPLVSFEGACGLAVPPPSGRARIVVFLALGGQLEGGCQAIISQGFPQLVRVSEAVVRPDHSRTLSERAPVLCQVRMLNETPLVPDLERLEAMIAEETNVRAEPELG